MIGRARGVFRATTLCALAAAAACGGARKNDTPPIPPAKTEIVVGFSYTGSGVGAAACRSLIDGYQLWADTVNAKGGLLTAGRSFKVTLKSYDDAGNALRAAGNTERLIAQDHVDLLLGPCGPSLTDAVATVAERYRRVLVASDPEADATLARRYGFVFDSAPSAAQFPTPAVEYLAARTPEPKLAVLWADDATSEAVGAQAVAQAQAAGLSVDAIGKYPSGTAGFSAQVARIAGDGAPAVLIAGDAADAATLLTALQQGGMRPAAFVVATPGDWNALPAALGSLGDGVFALTPWAGSAAAYADPLFGSPAAYAAAFSAAAGRQPDARAALATAGAEVLGDAVARAGTLDQERLRAALTQVTVTTVAGPFRAAPDGGNAGAAMALTQVRQGALVPVQAPAGAATPSPRRSPTP